MEINKQQLLTALEIVKPGLASKEVVEQSTSFAFVGGRVVTYNDELCISHPVEGLDIIGAVQAEKLYAFICKVKGDVLDIAIEGNQILLKSGRIRAALTLQAEIKLPFQQEIEEVQEWLPLPAKFNELTKFVAPCASKNMSTAILTCIHVGKAGFVEASDNYRIAKGELQEEMPVEDFLIPAHNMLQVVKVNPTMIAAGKGWMNFKTDSDTIISSRLFEDAYPNTARNFNVEGTQLTFPQTLVDSLDRASVFSKRDHMMDEMVEITIEGNRIKISSSCEEGWFAEDLNMRYNGDTIKFAVTPFFLKSILKETLVFTIGKGKLMFRGDNWIYVTALRG